MNEATANRQPAVNHAARFMPSPATSGRAARRPRRARRESNRAPSTIFGTASRRHLIPRASVEYPARCFLPDTVAGRVELAPLFKQERHPTIEANVAD